MADMTRQRFVVATFALVLGLTLGSCSPFSDYVSDHWPHFAGGEPDGMPPRPGTPGYTQFIAHGQPDQSANSPAQNPQPPAAFGTAAMINQKPAGTNQQPETVARPPQQNQQRQAPPVPAYNRPNDDSGVVHGGLY
jgi:hypothetical protein